MEKVGVALIVLILIAECGSQINRARCRKSRRFPNGITKYHGKKIAMHTCNKGYERFGPEFTICLNGEWIGPSTYCVRASCSPIRINSTNLSTVSSHNGAVVYFSCRPGHELRGSNVTFCNGEQWSSNLPTCVEAGKEPETTCDFETDFCGWMHDLNHDFDWKRKNNKTFFGHVSTGLKNDHTFGENGNGFYLYTEAFSSLENETARLISPVYKFENGFCFRFYYHMYGEGIGTLRVYVKKESDPASLRRIDPVFNATGSQRNGWLEKVIRVDEMNEYFQIVIEANKGTNIVNDIAVDDVALFDIDDCPEDENVTSTEITVTDIYDYGSCKERCNVTQTNESCSCIDSCLNDNTCCPDYKILCLYNESDFITDYISESTDASTLVTTIMEISSITTQPTTTTKKPTTTTKTPTTTTMTTTKKTIPTIMKTTTIKKTIPTISTTKKPIPTIPTTKKPIPTILTTKKPIPKIPTTKKPIPTILTEKLIPMIPTTKKSIPKIPTTKKLISTTPPPKPIKPSENEVVKTASQTTIRAITDDFPQPTMFIETDFITEEVPQNERRISVSHDVEKSSNTLMLSIIIGSGVVGVVFVVAAVFAVRRFRLRFRGSSKYSDSMSDVRFLAADEALDFTMRTADD